MGRCVSVRTQRRGRKKTPELSSCATDQQRTTQQQVFDDDLPPLLSLPCRAPPDQQTEESTRTFSSERAPSNRSLCKVSSQPIDDLCLHNRISSAVPHLPGRCLSIDPRAETRPRPHQYPALKPTGLCTSALDNKTA